jgi:SAM-dependent methyltransferase
VHSLVHGRLHRGARRDNAFGSPRLYDFVANVLFFGRRRATFQALIAAAGVQPGERVLDVGCGTSYFARLLQRALRLGGNLLVAEAQIPSRGLGWRLLARIHGFDRMARMVPNLQPIAVQAGFDEIRAGEAPPWLRYIAAVKPPPCAAA